MLLLSDRIKVKEAACRKIIKLFAEKKKENADKGSGTTPGGPTTPGETPGGLTINRNADES